MKKQLDLHYIKSHASIVRFSDPKLDEKRQWIARLIAQLLDDQVTVVCIDESSFRHDLRTCKQWKPGQVSIAEAHSRRVVLDRKECFRRAASPVRPLAHKAASPAKPLVVVNEYKPPSPVKKPPVSPNRSPSRLAARAKQFLQQQESQLEDEQSDDC